MAVWLRETTVCLRSVEYLYGCSDLSSHFCILDVVENGLQNKEVGDTRTFIGNCLSLVDSILVPWNSIMHAIFYVDSFTLE